MTNETSYHPKRILVIPDVQAKPNVCTDHLEWCGKYIVQKRPDIIVCLGDFFDFESLSSYDKGKAAAEGRRFVDDLAAGKKAMERLLAPMEDLQIQQKRFRKALYKPQMIFLKGNHCDRADRFARDNPEFQGYVGSDICGLESYGWEVHEFLELVEVDGIFFTHYLANPFSGRPYSGTVMNQLKNVGRSFVVGHKQILDVCIRPTLDGKMQIAIQAGAFYMHDESYKGPQNNNHWRGIIMLNDVREGYADVMPVSLEYLRRRYG